MGGRAMKIIGIETERKTTKQHLEIQNKLVPIIKEMFNTEVAVVEFYRSKETHGDLDLLILNHGKLGNIVEKLKERFGPVNNNGNVVSFEYDKYQIDIIPQSTSNWETAEFFFSWDPTGNLFGKIAHGFGLKYGFQGLVYPFRSKTGVSVKDIVISKDPRKITEFLGFDTLEDIFEYVINSKYFSFDKFKLENLTSIDRRRNQKRKTYNEFLTYVNSKNIENNYTWDKDKASYLPIIDASFPEVELFKQLAKLQIHDSHVQYIASRFNGRLIMNDFPELKGKSLGDEIQIFKKLILEKNKTNNWVDAAMQELKADDNALMKQFKNNINKKK